MSDPLNLTGAIAAGIDGAAARGHSAVLGYVGGDGFAALSYRGSLQVHGPQELAFWARNATDGFVAGIQERPNVSLLFHEPDGPGPRYLSIRGRARVDASVNDAVYAAMIEAERGQDPDAKGVAVIIDVDSVRGFADGKPFSMER